MELTSLSRLIPDQDSLHQKLGVFLAPQTLRGAYSDMHTFTEEKAALDRERLTKQLMRVLKS